MRRFILVSFIIGVSGFATTSLATDVVNGKKLYDSKCQGCHDSHIFTRPNRIVHTYEALISRVEFCDSQIKANLTDGEQSDVTDFLNQDYFKFIKF